jgi:hypothetical protein
VLTHLLLGIAQLSPFAPFSKDMLQELVRDIIDWPKCRNIVEILNFGSFSACVSQVRAKVSQYRRDLEQ